MLFLSATALLLVSLVQASKIPEKPPHPEPPSCHSPGVTSFSAAFYTAMTLTNDDPDHTIFSLRIPGKEAGRKLQKVVFRELTKLKVCNAAIVSKTVGHCAADLDVFAVVDYFRRKGFTVGTYMEEHEKMSCDNAVEQALYYYALVQGELDKLDKTKIDSYMTAVTRGVLQYVLQQGWGLAEASYYLAGYFCDEFSQA